MFLLLSAVIIAMNGRGGLTCARRGAGGSDIAASLSRCVAAISMKAQMSRMVAETGRSSPLRLG